MNIRRRQFLDDIKSVMVKHGVVIEEIDDYDSDGQGGECYAGSTYMFKSSHFEMDTRELMKEVQK